jgi:hypothetical protein
MGLKQDGILSQQATGSAAFVKYDNTTGLPVELINSFFCIFLLASHLTNAAVGRLTTILQEVKKKRNGGHPLFSQ